MTPAHRPVERVCARELGTPSVIAVIAVIGPGTPDRHAEEWAEEVGRRVAEAGALLVTGGMGGVMAAASRGAREAGGTVLGILPGDDRRDASAWVDVAVPTGIGELRNGLVVRAADALVAVGGGYGTLSEIAFALKIGRPVVGIGTWRLLRPGSGELDGGIREADGPAGAVALALALCARSPSPPDPSC